jgi:hypothetical protein
MQRIEWPSQMAPLVPQLRRLQHAANMLSLSEFALATGWPEDDYLLAKYREFQKLGRLHVFDDHVLKAAVEYYEKQHVVHQQGCECGETPLCTPRDRSEHVECDCGRAGSVYGQHADNCALKVAHNV